LTRATLFLKGKHIPFEIVEYEHLEKGAEFASGAIGMPIEQTIKTLVVELSPKGYLTLLMPGHRSVSFKKLAKICGVKRAAMVTADMAERLTGYLIGGISPFGMKNPLRVVMDAGLLAFNKVAINGGKRGIMLVMNPADIVKSVDADVVDL